MAALEGMGVVAVVVGRVEIPAPLFLTSITLAQLRADRKVTGVLAGLLGVLQVPTLCVALEVVVLAPRMRHLGKLEEPPVVVVGGTKLLLGGQEVLEVMLLYLALGLGVVLGV
jgi:hypothetical protein